MNLEKQDKYIVQATESSPVSNSLISALTWNVSLKYSDFVKDLEKIFKEKNYEKKQKMKENLIQGRLSQLWNLIFHEHPQFLEESKTQHRFITPKTKLRKSLVLNDVSIYMSFLNNLENAYNKRNSPDIWWIIMFCINYTLIEYFGNYTTTQKEVLLNKKLFDKYSKNWTVQINLNKLKWKWNATSIEKASIAHNLLKFMGINSILKLSLNCKFDWQLWNEPYAFCCLSTSKWYYIYEPTHSIVHYNQDWKLKTVAPNLVKITKDQFEKLINNEPVEIITTIKEKVYNWEISKESNKKMIVYAT